MHLIVSKILHMTCIIILAGVEYTIVYEPRRLNKDYPHILICPVTSSWSNAETVALNGYAFMLSSSFISSCILNILCKLHIVSALRHCFHTKQCIYALRTLSLESFCDLIFGKGHCSTIIIRICWYLQNPRGGCILCIRFPYCFRHYLLIYAEILSSNQISSRIFAIKLHRKLFNTSPLGN